MLKNKLPNIERAKPSLRKIPLTTKSCVIGSSDNFNTATTIISDDSEIVSATNDGLVTPEIYQQIVDAISNYDSGREYFKIYPGVDAYWYYFNSFGGLISINNRQNTEIVFEVDEQRLYSLLSFGVCTGDIGVNGDQGNRGTSGIKAPDEPAFLPITEHKFRCYVPQPYGTYIDSLEVPPICIRLYELYGGQQTAVNQDNYWSTIMSSKLVDNYEKTAFNRLHDYYDNQTNGAVGEYGQIALSNVLPSSTVKPIPLFEIDYSDGVVTLITNQTNIALEDIHITSEPNIGCLVVTIDNITQQNVVLKARQRGLTGRSGDIPSDMIAVVECDFNDASVRPNRSLVNLRTDCDSGVVYAEYARVTRQDAFSKITIDPTIGFRNSEQPISGRFVTVPVSSSDFREVGNTSFMPILDTKYSISKRDLKLADFTPEPGCPAKNHLSEYPFDWIDQTDIPACDPSLVWFNTKGIRPGKYPFDIIKKPHVGTDSGTAGDECCEDDFFYYPDYNC